MHPRRASARFGGDGNRANNPARKRLKLRPRFAKVRCMSNNLWGAARRGFRDLPYLRLLALAAVLAAQAGCATSDADLDYTRDKPVDNSNDHSWHGWNDSNY
jgi:hypothetical protein